MKEKFLFLYWIFQFFLATGLFIIGFFPVKKMSEVPASVNDLPTKIINSSIASGLYERSVDKLVIMVIDAMRYDFIDGDTIYMPFLNAKLQTKKSCLLKVRVEAPTVTMPRIKALMTGNVPAYLDVILNLRQKSLITDSLLSQAKSSGLTSVFYGDNTWLEIFPNVFNRSEGTSSFFVTDYTQVDNNVTRHVKTELNRSDWDIMILHYLGLDHIGHLEGPSSPLIKPKLLEMDNIISMIDGYIMNMSTQAKKVVLLVCSDHGMKDTGSHGGTSDPEIFIPYVFLNYECDSHLRFEEINQIDITPLLSVLLGIPIPSESFGKLHYKLLYELDIHSAVYSTFYNAQHLKDLYDKYDKDIDIIKMYNTAINFHDKLVFKNISDFDYNSILQKYYHAQKAMSESVIKKSVHFDMLLMCTAWILLIQVIFNIFFGSTLCFTIRRMGLCICFLILMTIEQSGLKRIFNLSSLSPNLGILLEFFLSTNMFLLKPHITTSCMRRSTIEILGGKDVFIFIFLLATMLVQASSSFVEEEHEIWYFMFSSFLLVSVYFGNKWHIFLMIIHAVFRHMNNTGVRHANMPDIGDWLQKEENCFWLVLFFFAATLFTARWCVGNIMRRREFSFGRRISELAFFIMELWALALINLLNRSSFRLFATSPVIRDIPTQIFSPCAWLGLHLLHILLGLKTYISYVFRTTRKLPDLRLFMACFIDALVLAVVPLMCFAYKPHNFFTIPYILYYSNIFKKLCGPNIFRLTAYYLGLGMVCFFYQGNSNNLATIDISAGYIGLNDPSMVLSGFFIFICTFGPQILSTLLLFRDIYSQQRLRNQQYKCFKIVSLMCATYMLYYSFVVNLQKYHLFVWSVFSPKLLYVGVMLSLYCLLIVIVIVVELSYSSMFYIYNFFIRDRMFNV